MRMKSWKLALMVVAAAYGVWVGVMVVPEIVKVVVPAVVRAVVG